MKVNFKKMSKKDRKYFITMMIFFAIILVIGIQSTYAYYNKSTDSFQMLAAKVGDFDTGDGDINLMIYKEVKKGGGVYTRTYGVPALEYDFKPDQTTCSSPVTLETITCTKDGDSGCRYTYNPDSREFTLTSNEKVTCKFYFDKKSESDINILIMKEDVNGVDGTYENKHYKMVDEIPAYGYKYNTAVCTPNGDTVTPQYNSDTRTFTLSTDQKTTCYAYFDSTGTADIITNVYVQSAPGSETYNKVSSIPVNKTYKKAVTKESKCYKIDETGTVTETPIESDITYEGGYITIGNIGEKQSCDVYLDLN